MPFVLDASALVYAVRSPEPPAASLRRRLVQETAHAPHLIDAEVGNVLRRHVLAGDLEAADARSLLSGASTVVICQLNDTGAGRERRALRLIGGAFIALAIYVAAALL